MRYPIVRAIVPGVTVAAAVGGGGGSAQVDVTLDDSPGSAGTIYANGQSNPNGWGFIFGCTPGNTFSWQVKATPDSGYGFSYWSISGASLSSTTANPVTGSLTCPSSGSTAYVTITANYVLLPDILSQFSYGCGNCSVSTGSAPSENTANPSSVSGFTESYQCGVQHNYDGLRAYSDPWCLLVATGSYNSQEYVYLAFNDNASNCCNTYLFDYPNGNVSVKMTLVLTGSNSANVSAMGVDFIAAASGNIANLGNGFVDNYADTLDSSVYDLGNAFQNAAGYYVEFCDGLPSDLPKCHLGEAYQDIVYGLTDLSNVMGSSGLTQSFYNDQVPYVGAIGAGWTNSNLGCAAAGLGAGLAIAGISAAIILSAGLVIPILIASGGIIESGIEVYINGCL